MSPISESISSLKQPLVVQVSAKSALRNLLLETTVTDALKSDPDCPHKRAPEKVATSSAVYPDRHSSRQSKNRRSSCSYLALNPFAFNYKHDQIFLQAIERPKSHFVLDLSGQVLFG
jgi:hypothetical protein